MNQKDIEKVVKQRSWQATLSSIKNPMVFNGLGILAITTVAVSALFSSLPSEIKTYMVTGCLLAVFLIVAFLNFFAWRQPRFLTYGPSEYLRESELEHERKIKAMESGKDENQS